LLVKFATSLRIRCAFVKSFGTNPSQDEVKDDLVPDIIEVLTSVYTRLDGRRSARDRAEKAIRAATGP
jgi:predicted site-specific integrase-resolvase